MVYDQKYLVETNSGEEYRAYYRKGEDYDWWEEVGTGREIHNVILYEELGKINNKQIRLINWMYNYCKLEMVKRNDEHSQSDIDKLTKCVKERFPEHADSIISFDYLM